MFFFSILAFFNLIEEENLDESTMQGKKPENNENETEVEKDSIQDTVVNSYHLAQNYKYDKRNNLWCELTFAVSFFLFIFVFSNDYFFQLPLSFNKIDLTAILKEVASKSIIRETPGIKRAITYKKDDRLYLRTDGINIVVLLFLLFLKFRLKILFYFRRCSSTTNF